MFNNFNVNMGIFLLPEGEFFFEGHFSLNI